MSRFRLGGVPSALERDDSDSPIPQANQGPDSDAVLPVETPRPRIRRADSDSERWATSTRSSGKAAGPTEHGH